eukprot:jgi/Hompol1/5258/HPOL_004276-RA
MPVDLALVFELSRTVVPGQRFDIVMHSLRHFDNIEQMQWKGRVWADLTVLRPCTTSPSFAARFLNNRAGNNNDPQSRAQLPILEGSLEHAIQVILTRYSENEFSEGMFVVKADNVGHVDCICSVGAKHLISLSVI